MQRSRSKGLVAVQRALNLPQKLTKRRADVYKPKIGQRYRIPATVFQDADDSEGPMSDRFKDAEDWREQFLYAKKVGDRDRCFGLHFDGDKAPWYDTPRRTTRAAYCWRENSSTRP